MLEEAEVVLIITYQAQVLVEMGWWWSRFI
jgi:hypothetical protein